MRSRWNLPIYSVYVVLCLVVLGFIVTGLNVSAPWSHPYQVTATFYDAEDILTNNEVYMNGTKVGYVGDVTVVNGHAQVQMLITDAAALPLHSDATAQVRKKNLLGETYIDLQRGHGTATLASGSGIDLQHTQTNTEIDQVLGILDPETVQRVQLLINAAGTATTNNGQNMNDQAGSANQLITDLNGPAMTLSVHKQQLQDIIDELQRFYDTLSKQRDQVRDEFGTWNQVSAQMANQEQSIGGTVQQADQLLTNLDTLVTGESGNLNSTLTNLPQTLTSLNAFLDQSNTILGGLTPYRRSIHDVFPNLGTSFADMDPFGQHFWSVYSVNCNGDPSSNAPGGNTSNGCTTGGGG